MKINSQLVLFSVVLFCLSANAQQVRRYEFIPNQGQEQNGINYSTKINSGKIFFVGHSMLYHFMDNSDLLLAHEGKLPMGKERLRGHVYEMNWVGAKNPIYRGKNETKHYYNYFRGNIQSKWKGGIHAQHDLTLQELYPGIDVAFTTNTDERMEYTYTVSAGYSPFIIKQEYTGVKNIKLSKNGDVIIKTQIGSVTETKPVAWQIINDKRVEVECRFIVSQNENTIVSYEFPKGYNKAYDLVIDPVLIFGSSSGSFADNFGMTATYDNGGALFSGGTAFNIGFPTTTGAYDTTANPVGSTTTGYGVTDVVLTKYAPDGTYLMFSTYLGGGNGTLGTETVHSLIVNENDELMCFGATSSTDFPTTTGAYSNTHMGGSLITFYYNGVYFKPSGTDIYVTKFNSSGTALIGSTLVGGSGNDGVNYKVTSGSYSSAAAYDSLTSNYGDQFRGEIMIDALNNIYIASTTRSSDFPMVGAFQPTIGGQSDAVLLKFDPLLTTLMYSTFIGGTDKDAGYSVKLDGTGNIFVAGGTASSNFPVTASTMYPSYQGGKADGFVVKFNPSGSSITAGTFIGTNQYDQSMFVEIDKDDKVYLFGNTMGMATFPISAPYSNPNSGQYIVRLDNNLTTYELSTLFGNGTGSVNISPSAFLVDVCGNIYISGWGANILLSSPLGGMPITSGAFQSTPGDGYNFYIACFQRNLSSLLYATYFGGALSREHVDGGTSRFDKYGIIYQSVCAGCGGNDDFPTTPGAWSQVNNSSNCNNGVFKFDFEISPIADFTTNVISGCQPLTVTFTNNSPPGQQYVWDFGNGDTTSVIFSPTITYSDTGTYVVYLITEDSICGLIDTAQQTVFVGPVTSVAASADTFFCIPATITLQSGASGGNIVWSDNPAFSDTLNNSPNDTSLNVSIDSDSTFYIHVYNNGCYSDDTINIYFASLNPTITGLTTICIGDTAILTATNSVPGQTYTIDWSPNAGIVSGDGTSTIVIAPLDSTTYTVVFSTSSGCSDTASYFITVVDPTTTGFVAWPDDYLIFNGDSTIVHAGPAGGVTYNWVPPIALSNPDSINSYAFPTTTTIYSVTADFGTCTATDTLIIRVMEFLCNENYVYVPNAFTPNADGKNDVLYVRTSDRVEIYFAVFERWGEKVFETSDRNIGWDGKVNNREADPAVFDYYLRAKCPGGQEIFKKGNITLIR